MRKKTDIRQLGLIGYPLSHSFSKKYFSEKFERENIRDWAYELYPLPSIEVLPDLLHSHSNLKGLNVTIPYKEAVIPFLDEIDESAVFGAVNTIKIEKGKLIGFNTDTYGFEYSIVPLLRDYHCKALVLGTGGASKAIIHVLKKLNIDYLLVSRSSGNGLITYEDIDSQVLENYKIIINTTPLGMSPRAGLCPNLPYKYLSEQHLLYDLVYNPEETVFLQHGKRQKTHIKNGLEMLYLQAERAWEIWQIT